MFRLNCFLAALCLLSASILAAEPPIPPEILGEWQMSQGSGSSFKDPATGATSAPNINVFAYRILPDAKYEHAALLTSSSYGCTMQITGYETGVITIQANNTIVFQDREAKFASKDNCRPDFNYEKPGQLSRTEYTWRTDRDEAGDVLILRRADGSEDRFHRVKEEKKQE